MVYIDPNQILSIFSEILMLSNHHLPVQAHCPIPLWCVQKRVETVRGKGEFWRVMSIKTHKIKCYYSKNGPGVEKGLGGGGERERERKKKVEKWGAAFCSHNYINHIE